MLINSNRKKFRAVQSRAKALTIRHPHSRAGQGRAGMIFSYRLWLFNSIQYSLLFHFSSLSVPVSSGKNIMDN